MIPLVAIAAANVAASLQKGKEHSTLGEIAEATAEEYGIPTVLLLGKGRGSVHRDARRVAVYLSAKVAMPKEIATFFGCDVSRIEVPEGEERRRMNRILNRLKGIHETSTQGQEKKSFPDSATSSPVLADWFPRLFDGLGDATSRTSSGAGCLVKRAFGR